MLGESESPEVKFCSSVEDREIYNGDAEETRVGPSGRGQGGGGCRRRRGRRRVYGV